MEKIFWGKLQLKTFMAVMLLNLVVVIAVSVFFQQRSLSYNILKSQMGRTPLKTSDMLGPSPKNIYVYSQLSI